MDKTYDDEKRIESEDVYPEISAVRDTSVPLNQLPKSRWQRLGPTFACGVGLFSDGYVQAVSFDGQITTSFVH